MKVKLIQHEVPGKVVYFTVEVTYYLGGQHEMYPEVYTHYSRKDAETHFKFLTNDITKEEVTILEEFEI